MKIYNFNYTTLPWKRIQHQDFPLLNKKIISLFDWMSWYQPDWDIINSVNNWRHGEELSTDLSQIPSLEYPFKKQITLRINNQTKTVDLFDVTELEYLQGFYNDSINNSGILVYHKDSAASYWNEYIAQTESTATYSELINIAQVATAANLNTPFFIHNVRTGGYFVEHLEDNENLRAALAECNLRGYQDVALVSTTEDLESSFACYFEDNSYFYVFVPLDDPNYDTVIACYRGDAVFNNIYHGVRGTILEGCTIKRSGDIYIIDSSEGGNKDKVTFDNVSSLPTGYCCISKWQQEGLSDAANIKQYRIDNYYIWPLGNGGFYSNRSGVNESIMNYLQNDYEKFVNKTYINFLTDIPRYIVDPSIEVFDQGTIVKDLNSYSIFALESNNQSRIYWLGEDTIIPYVYLDSTPEDSNTFYQEEVFFDSFYSLDTEAINSTLVTTLSYNIQVENPLNIVDQEHPQNNRYLKIGVF